MLIITGSPCTQIKADMVKIQFTHWPCASVTSVMSSLSLLSISRCRTSVFPEAAKNWKVKKNPSDYQWSWRRNILKNSRSKGNITFFTKGNQSCISNLLHAMVSIFSFGLWWVERPHGSSEPPHSLWILFLWRGKEQCGPCGHVRPSSPAFLLEFSGHHSDHSRPIKSIKLKKVNIKCNNCTSQSMW